MHLFKRESEREEAFRRVAGKTSRETVATERGDLGGIGIESQFYGIERRRPPPLATRLTLVKNTASALRPRGRVFAAC